MRCIASERKSVAMTRSAPSFAAAMETSPHPQPSSITFRFFRTAHPYCGCGCCGCYSGCGCCSDKNEARCSDAPQRTLPVSSSPDARNAEDDCMIRMECELPISTVHSSRSSRGGGGGEGLLL